MRLELRSRAPSKPKWKPRGSQREKAFFPTRVVVVFLRRLFEGAQPFQMVPRELFLKPWLLPASHGARNLHLHLIASTVYHSDQASIKTCFDTCLKCYITIPHFFGEIIKPHCLIKKFLCSSRVPPATLELAGFPKGLSSVYSRKRKLTYICVHALLLHKWYWVVKKLPLFPWFPWFW